MGKSSKPSLNVICWNNGVGLTRDMHLLADALGKAGFDVHLSPIGRGKLRKWLRPVWMRMKHGLRGLLGRGPVFDANLMLEHVRPEDMPIARRNWFIPNPEWSLPADVALLPKVDAVLTKTAHAGEIFRALGSRQAAIGFTSEDRRDETIPRQRQFFHLAGRSSNKGTQRLIALWQRHPEWPKLTIVQSRYTAKPIQPPAANIEHRVDYLEDAQLKQLQNSHRFHLCPSETEGFGHYLVEAMSIGAVAITTDGEPMNELVDASRGILVAASHTGEQHLAKTYYFCEAAMEAAIERAIAMSEDECQTLGNAARAWYEANHAAFPQRLQTAITALLEDRA